MHSSTTDRVPASLWQRWFLGALAVLFIALSVQYCFKVRSNGDGPERSAIARWRNQILHVADEDIYDRYNYPNPPIMAILLEPIAQLPPLAGSLCWFYMKLGMAVVALLWTFSLIETPERPFPNWAKAVTILLCLRPVMGDLSHGNVNLFILCLIIGALYAFHRGRDWTAGLTLALAISCKVTPALFVPYFIWKRAWKALASCAVGLVLFLVIIPGTIHGYQHNFHSLSSWANNMVRPFLVDGTVTSDHLNQSLPGLVFRLLTDSPSIVDDKGVIPSEFQNVASLSPREASWLLKGFLAVFAGLIVWSCRTPTTPRLGWRLAAEFSLVVLGMLLFSERTWKHHCVTLMLPFAVFCYYLSACRPGRALRNYLIASLAMVVLLMTSTSTPGRYSPLDAIAKEAHVLGAYVWAYLIMIAALIVLLKQRDPGHQFGLPPAVGGKA